MWLLFLIIIGVVVYFVLQSTGHRTDRRLGSDFFRRDETPMDILKKRYAKGEISKEEYEGMKKDLED